MTAPPPLPGPAQMDAIANRGALFMEFGRKAEAIKAMEEAAKAFPNAPGILFGQTDLRRFERGDPLIGQMQALLAREGISLADRATLHFGLGKAFLDIGDSEQAFRHYDEGNRLKRSTFAYDADANERWMAGIARGLFARAARGEGGRGRALGPAGVRRRHAALRHDAGRADPRLAPDGPRRGRAQAAAGAASTGSTTSRRRVRDLDARPNSRRSARPISPTSTPMAAGRRHVVDKMPSNFLLAGFIRLILPDARIIHCRRDPVDTCLSCYTKLFAGEQAFAYDQTELGRFHRAYQGLMAHWRATLPASHFLEVDYEAMVDDLEAQARRMLDFLGLPWDERVLRFHETERPVRTASVNQVRQPIYRTSVGRWRKHAAHLQPLLDALRSVNDL